MNNILGKERRFDEAVLEQSARIDKLIEEVMDDYLGARKSAPKAAQNGTEVRPEIQTPNPNGAAAADANDQAATTAQATGVPGPAPTDTGGY